MENIKILNLLHNSKYDDTPWIEKIKIPEPNYYIKNINENNGRFVSKDSCLGEIYFYSSKFWKLQLMLHYKWDDITVVGYGFSVCSYNTSSANKILDVLDKYNIKYRVNLQAYAIQIRISTKKSNLEIIDKIYSKFYAFIKNNADYKSTMENWDKIFM